MNNHSMLQRFFVFLFFIISHNSYACECLWQGSFARAYQQADLIISGEVIKTQGNSFDIAISGQHFDRAINNKEFNPVVRLWVDNGKLCRPQITEFPVGSQWLLALKKITHIPDDGFNPGTPNISYGRINDYYLSKCGANWLELKEGYVTGNLVNGRRWQWKNNKMNPVLLPLLDAYIKEIIPKQALIEAAKPLSATKKLMEETKSFLQSQQ